MINSIAPKHIFSGLRLTIAGLILAGSSIFLMPNAFAQDTVYIKSQRCPDLMLVTDAGELTDPYTKNTVVGELLFSHFVEMVHFSSSADMQFKLVDDVYYGNPLRTLKRGNRLERIGGCQVDNGWYLFTVAVITGPQL